MSFRTRPGFEQVPLTGLAPMRGESTSKLLALCVAWSQKKNALTFNGQGKTIVTMDREVATVRGNRRGC